MTTALLYLAGIIVVFLVIHFARARSSELWRRSVPLEPAQRTPENSRGHTNPDLSMPGDQDELARTERDDVCTRIGQDR